MNDIAAIAKTLVAGLRREHSVDPVITERMFGWCLEHRTLIGGQVRHEIPIAFQLEFLGKHLEKLLGAPVKYDSAGGKFVMATGEKVTKYLQKQRNQTGSSIDICNLGELANVRRVLITASPLDMIYASECCSYTSCYRWEGEYASSSIAMAETPGMLMAYMTTDDFEQLDDPHYKHGRCWLHYTPTKISTFAGYGSMQPLHKKMIREYLHELTAAGSRWRVRHNVDSQENDEDNYLYIDSASVSVLLDEDGNRTEEYSTDHIEFPTEVFCMTCGEYHRKRTFSCGSCKPTTAV